MTAVFRTPELQRGLSGSLQALDQAKIVSMMKRIWIICALIAFTAAGSAFAQRDVGDWAYSAGWDPITDENVSYVESSAYALSFASAVVGTKLGIQCSASSSGIVVYLVTELNFVPGTEFEVMYRVGDRVPRDVAWRASNVLDI